MSSQNVGLLDGVFYDQNSQVNKAQENIIYVGKHGDDANDGKTMDRALLTITYALTLASAGDTIQILDNGTYTEDLTCVGTVNIHAPNATLVGAHTLAGNHQFTFYQLTVANSTTGLTKTGTSDVFLNIRVAVVGESAKFIAIADTAKVFANIDSITVNKNSTFYYVTSGTPTLYLKYNYVILGQTGTGCIFADQTNGGTFLGIGNTFNDFYDATMVYGTPSGSTSFRMTVNSIVVKYASNINTNISAKLFANGATTSATYMLNAGTGTVSIQPYGTNKANGICPLDSTTKVPVANLPPAIVGGMTYKGSWDCSGGAYPVGPATSDYYICSVAGTISGTAYTVGDYLIYNGASWDKIDFGNIYLQIDQTVPQVTVGTFTFPAVTATGTVQGEQITSTHDATVANDLGVGNDILANRDVTATRDLTALEDLTVMRDSYLHGDVYIGQGYGSGGSLGYAGVIAHDGSANWQGNHNFTAAGIRIMEDAIATPTSIGAKGELTYGTDTYDFLYQALADNTWRKMQVTRSGGIGEIVEAATGTVNLTVNDFGKFLINSATATYTLPAYNTTGFKAGDKLTLYVGNNSYFRLSLSGTDTARYVGTATAAGGYFRSTTVGSKLTIMNSGTGEWIITDLQGTWTYDS